MLFCTILAFITLLSAKSALASPVLDHQNINSTYHLKTRTTDPSSDKNGLYVSSYHTGAGLSDAVLTSNKTHASRCFLNDTYMLFDFGPDVPWGMNMGEATNYAGKLAYTRL
jgi:hypothetical protein